MSKFGLYDHAQKAWLHVYDTLEEAQEKLLRIDVKTAVVAPYGEAPSADSEGAPAAPQENVAVVTGNEAAPNVAAPEPEAPADPEVAADVVA
jgi:hypothetical protein